MNVCWYVWCIESEFGKACNNLSLNTAFVVSSSDLEVSLISPSFVPAVSNQPVRRTWFNSPSNDFDSVASQSWAWSVVVNSALVGQEIVVDGEGSLNGTVGHDFGLDLGDLRWDTVNRWSMDFIISESFGVSANTVLVAFRSRFAGSARSVFSSVDVVIARGEGVRLAPVLWVVKPSSNDTLVFPIVEGTWRVASIASVSAAQSAAGKDIFSWDSGLQLLSTGNADTIRHGLSSSESPTWSASTLISDLLDWFAVGPGLSRWKFFRNVLKRLNFSEGKFEVFRGFKSSHEVLDGLEIHSIEVFVVTCSPWFLDWVDVINDGLEVKEDFLFELGEGGHCKQSEHEDSYEFHDRFIINQSTQSILKFKNRIMFFSANKEQLIIKHSFRWSHEDSTDKSDLKMDIMYRWWLCLIGCLCK